MSDSPPPVVNVSIFAGGRQPSDESILSLVLEWCKCLASIPYAVVTYGGGDSGVMKIVADSIPASRLLSFHSRQIMDKSPGSLRLDGADELRSVFFATTAERKEKLVEYADIVICFPGGLGTLDELLSTLEQKKEGVLPRLQSILLVGVEFWKGLEQQIGTCTTNNFIQPKHTSILIFRATIQRLKTELAAAVERPQATTSIHKSRPPLLPPLRVTVVIPTIGRPALARAIASAANSARYARERLAYPSLLIDFTVCVDHHHNEDCIDLLVRVAQMTNHVQARVLANKRTPGLAGTMNTALMALLDTTGREGDRSKVRELQPSIDLHYIAVLDDDDEWTKEYLFRVLCKITSATENKPPWLASAIIRRSTDESGSATRDKVLYPRNCNADAFLIGNPGIQGSNTFAQLQLMLKAGLYDERLSSSTDRDLCLRLLTINGPPLTLDDPLVIHHVDAEDCSRLSNRANPAKLVGLSMFWAKWQQMMSSAVEESFFDRCNKYFQFSKDAIVRSAHEQLRKKQTPIRLVQPDSLKALCNDDEGRNQLRLAVLFASHELDNANALLANLADCNKVLTECGGRACYVILLLNGDLAENLITVPKELFVMCIDRSLAQEVLLESSRGQISTIHRDATDPQPREIDHEAESKRRQKKLEIAESRCILHQIAKLQRAHFDRFLFLDDDKELGPDFLLRCVGIPNELCDVALGADNFAPPVPSMSTWRCQLVSCVHALLSSREPSIDDERPPHMEPSVDSYYDLSRTTFNHLEFDTRPVLHSSISETLANVACGVPCFAHRAADASVLPDCLSTERGGCCLVLNPHYLLPFPIPSLGDEPTRRSDFMWASHAQQQGARILRLAVLAVKHKRHAGPHLPTASDLFQTLLKDTIGSALYQLSSYANGDQRTVQMRHELLSNRVRQVLASCHRVEGCFNIVETMVKSKGLPPLNPRGLEALATMREAINKALSFDWSSLALSAGVSLYMSQMGDISSHLLKDINIRRAMAFLPYHDAKRRNQDYVHIGGGQEGRVFHEIHSGLAFKVFYQPHDLENFMTCLQLVEPQIRICNSWTICYPFVSGKPYRGGHGPALFRLACHLHQLFHRHQIVFWDVKPQNLIVTESQGELRIVDFGKDWKTGESANCFEGCLRRLWACFLFGRWEDRAQLGEMLRRCRKEKSPPEEFGSGYSTFRTAVYSFGEEDQDAGYGPDEAIASWIGGKICSLLQNARSPDRPVRVLDYGCGNGKLVQLWAQHFPNVEFTGFDPKGPEVWAKHADSFRVHYATTTGELHQKTSGAAGYDMIVLSRVLCVIEKDSDVLDVLSHVRSLLRPGLQSTVEIICCLSTTATRRMCDCPSPCPREKLGYPSGKPRQDFQRTLHHVKRLCAASGLRHVLPCDYLYALELNEFQKAPVLTAVTAMPLAPNNDGGEGTCLTSTLLIRCCDQDAKFVYNQLTHLTSALQQQTQFNHVKLLIDVPRGNRRPREFFEGDALLLRRVADRLLAEHVVDEVICPPLSEISQLTASLFHLLDAGGLTTTHHDDGVPFGASLYALLRCVDTDLVLHMDCDMLLLRQGEGQEHDPVKFALTTFERNPLAWTLSLPIVSKRAEPPSCRESEPFRFEVRGGWLRLCHVRSALRENDSNAFAWSDFLQTHWYRWLDRIMLAYRRFESLRYAAGPQFGMIHVPNTAKQVPYLHHVLLRQVAEGLVCVDDQAGHVDLNEEAFRIRPLHNCDLVVVVCGKDVSSGVAARCARGIVVAASKLAVTSTPARPWAKIGVALVLDDTPYDDCLVTMDIFQRAIKTAGPNSTPELVLQALTPETRQGCLRNLHFAVEHLCCGEGTVIVTCDLDDELLECSLLNVWSVFGQNEETLVACGGAVRTHKAGLAKPNLELVEVVPRSSKPAHRIASQGCYAHLRAFRRGHFLRPAVVSCFQAHSGCDYWDLANDWAFMVPMALLANVESSKGLRASAVYNFSQPMLLYDRRTPVDRGAREVAISAIVEHICQQSSFVKK